MRVPQRGHRVGDGARGWSRFVFFIVRCLQEKERGGTGVTIGELRAFAGGSGEVDERREGLPFSGGQISFIITHETLGVAYVLTVTTV